MTFTFNYIRIKQLNSTKMLVFGLLGSILISVGGCSRPQLAESSNVSEAKRIVSVGGYITETVYALGAEAALAGTDTSSVYPESAAKLPQVGYQRTLSAEGVISLYPDLLLISPDAGPPAAIEQIEATGIKVVRITGETTVEGAKTRIRQIATAVGKYSDGEQLVEKLETDLVEAQKVVSSRSKSPKVIFLYSRGSGAPQVSGTGTPADAIIKLAGGTNAVEGFEQYKPLTPEAMVAAQPDVILLPERGLQTMGGFDAILALPGVAETPAGKNRRIVAIDDVLLLGFTPRLGLAVKSLAEKIK